MKKRLIVLFVLILFVSLFAQSSKFVSSEEHGRLKDSLIKMTLRWEESIDLNNKLIEILENLTKDLRKINNDSVKVVLKKYNLDK